MTKRVGQFVDFLKQALPDSKPNEGAGTSIGYVALNDAWPLQERDAVLTEFFKRMIGRERNPDRGSNTINSLVSGPGRGKTRVLHELALRTSTATSAVIDKLSATPAEKQMLRDMFGIGITFNSNTLRTERSFEDDMSIALAARMLYTFLYVKDVKQNAEVQFSTFARLFEQFANENPDTKDEALDLKAVTSYMLAAIRVQPGQPNKRLLVCIDEVVKGADSNSGATGYEASVTTRQARITKMLSAVGQVMDTQVGVHFVFSSLSFRVISAGVSPSERNFVQVRLPLLSREAVSRLSEFERRETFPSDEWKRITQIIYEDALGTPRTLKEYFLHCADMKSDILDGGPQETRAKILGGLNSPVLAVTIAASNNPKLALKALVAAIRGEPIPSTDATFDEVIMEGLLLDEEIENNLFSWRPILSPALAYAIDMAFDNVTFTTRNLTLQMAKGMSKLLHKILMNSAEMEYSGRLWEQDFWRIVQLKVRALIADSQGDLNVDLDASLLKNFYLETTLHRLFTTGVTTAEPIVDPNNDTWHQTVVRIPWELAKFNFGKADAPNASRVKPMLYRPQSETNAGYDGVLVLMNCGGDRENVAHLTSVITQLKHSKTKTATKQIGDDVAKSDKGATPLSTADIISSIKNTVYNKDNSWISGSLHDTEILMLFAAYQDVSRTDWFPASENWCVFPRALAEKIGKAMEVRKKKAVDIVGAIPTDTKGAIGKKMKPSVVKVTVPGKTKKRGSADDSSEILTPRITMSPTQVTENKVSDKHLAMMQRLARRTVILNRSILSEWLSPTISRRPQFSDWKKLREEPPLRNIGTTASRVMHYVHPILKFGRR